MIRSGAIPFLLVTLFVSGLVAEDRRTDKSRLSIMTINTLFMWDGIDPEDGSSQIQFAWRGNPQLASEHMAEIAQLIKSTNPDIVNLVEIEGEDAVEKLNTDFLDGYGYELSFVEGTDTFTGQDVCMLSRIDPTEFGRDDRAATSGNTTRGVTKNYFAKMEVSGKKIALLGLHFLAIPSDSTRRDARQAQAKVIARKATELAADGYSIVVLGDFNDYDGAVDARDHINSTPITSVLSSIRDLQPFSPADDLVNVAKFLPHSSRFTAYWDKNDNGQIDEPGELTSIDHILLSKDLADAVTSVSIIHGFDPNAVTDHFPITVQIDVDRIGNSTVVAPVGPVTNGGESIVISKLLPNAVGDESQNEHVWLKNLGSGPADLTGWKLRDLSNNHWTLDRVGMMAAGQEVEVARNGEPMALTNTGDTIVLLNASGEVIDTVSYDSTDEGVEITIHN